MPPDHSRRSLYRVSYPITERPGFEMGRLRHEIVDCSEVGLRYDARNLDVPDVGTPIAGVIRFRRGGDLKVSGTVIRSRAGLVVVELTPPGIPFAHILLEQRYLRAKGHTLRR
jgi:hypothetical protein